MDCPRPACPVGIAAGIPPIVRHRAKYPAQRSLQKNSDIASTLRREELLMCFKKQIFQDKADFKVTFTTAKSLPLRQQGSPGWRFNDWNRSIHR
jgi:hypothetical protein